MSKIVFASILKPVTDTRMYEKMAKTIVLHSSAEVHIIGHAIDLIPSKKEKINFHPIFQFKRISFARIFAWCTFIRMINVIKPQIIVVCTHELLLPAVIYKMFNNKVQLIYDVQENYYLNILYTNSFTSLLKYPLSVWVRAKEIVCASFISHFILAETCFEIELKLMLNHQKYTLLPNQYEGEICAKKPFVTSKGFNVVYSGTIGTSYGIWETIVLTSKLYEIDAQISLTIIGFSADVNLIVAIQKYIADKPYITLIGGNTLVPHQQIIETLKKADFAVLSYQFNKSVDKRIPTKLYECLALRVPMLLPDYASHWYKITQPYTAAIPIDFIHFNARELYTQMLSTTFYEQGPAESVFQWNPQKLMDVFKLG